jgi:L-asparaginase II
VTPPPPHPAGLNRSGYLPLVEATRGGITESIHFGAVAVVDSRGRIVASVGNPGLVTFPRSSAKPLQAIPFIEAGGHETMGLSQAEVALMCASHLGTDAHVETLQGFHQKIGTVESDLRCGVHPPYHQPTAQAILRSGAALTPFRHNCSGKHTGMLAFARLNNWQVEDYLQPDHPVQQEILAAFAEMCDLAPDQVVVGVDGCTAPTFAVPIHNLALAYARLCDPASLSAARQIACRTITAAMWAEPNMVSGPGGFDTQVVAACPGRVLSKGGAEGYQALGVSAGVLGPDSPGLGIAIKISDGDLTSRARWAVALETLRQLGILSEGDLADLAGFGPATPIFNQNHVEVGELRPIFSL